MPMRTSWTADELMAMDFPDPKWAVPGMLAEGVNLLAGPPKAGRSWRSLSLALAVASGNRAFGSIDVQADSVLYLALEDTPCRLKSRMRKSLAGQPAPSGRTLAPHAHPRSRAETTQSPNGSEGEAGARWINLTSTLWLTRHPAVASGAATGGLDEDLLRAALPHLSDTVFRIRVALAADQLACGLRILAELATSSGTRDDHLAELAAFVTAGLEAPLSAVPAVR